MQNLRYNQQRKTGPEIAYALGAQRPGHFPDLAFFFICMCGFARVETSRPVFVVLGWYSDGNPGLGGSGGNSREISKKIKHRKDAQRNSVQKEVLNSSP